MNTSKVLALAAFLLLISGFSLMFGRGNKGPWLPASGPELPYEPEEERENEVVKALRSQRYSNDNPGFQVLGGFSPSASGQDLWSGSIGELYFTIYGLSGYNKAFFVRDSEQELWNYRFQGQPEVSQRWGMRVLHNDDYSQIMVRTEFQSLHLSFHQIEPQLVASHREFLEGLRIAPKADPNHKGFQIVWPLEPLPRMSP